MGETELPLPPHLPALSVPSTSKYEEQPHSLSYALWGLEEYPHGHLTGMFLTA